MLLITRVRRRKMCGNSAGFRALDAHGYTLVEVLAATVLLSIGILGVMSAMAASRDMQQRATWICIGRTIAQSKMEDMRGASALSIDGITSTTSDSRLPAGNQINVTVTRYPDFSQDKFFKALVTVSWPEGKGTRVITHESLISKI